MSTKPLLRLDRVWRLEIPFAAIPCRLLQGGLLRRLSAEAAQLYLLLALAADRRGLSFWSLSRIADELAISPGVVARLLADLQTADILVSDGTSHQLLSLPPPTQAPVPTPQVPRPIPSPRATEMPADIRECLRRLFSGLDH
jgi:hypothetical protein